MIPSKLTELSEIEVAQVLRALTSEEKRVIRLRFGLDDNRMPVTLEGVSQATGLTREQVRQTELRAFRKLGWLTPSL